MADLIEKGLIAGLLIEPERWIDEVSEIVTAEDFRDGTARALFQAAASIRRSGRTPEMWSIFAEAGFKVPPPNALEWVDETKSAHATGDLARRLKRSRVFEDMAPQMEELGRSNSPTARDEVNKALRQIEELDRRWTIKTPTDVIKSVLWQFENREEMLAKITPTGFPRLDELLDGGCRPGNLVCIGARTSVGKSSSLWSVSEMALGRGQRVLFVSAEMSAEDLFYRCAASHTRTKLRLIRRFLPEGQRAVAYVADTFKSWNLFIDDSGILTMSGLESMVDRYQPNVVIVDFIQRFRVSGKMETRASFFSDIANGLKTLAMKRGIVVYAASQLSRDIEKQDRKPTLSDFKESGGLEEAADVALMLWAATEEMVKPQRAVKGYLLKNRNGALGVVDFNFVADETRFEEAI